MKFIKHILVVLFVAPLFCFASNDSTTRSLAYLNTAKLYYNKQDNTKALTYFFKALEYIQRSDTFANENKTLIYCSIARSFVAKAALSNAAYDDEKAEEFIIKAFNTMQKCDTGKKIELYSSVLNTAGNIYRKKAFVTDSSMYLYKALNYFELALVKVKAINNAASIPRIETNIASTYSDLGQLEKALEYYTMAFDKLAAINDTKNFSLAFQNIGMLYFKKFEKDAKSENLTLAITYAKRALDTAVKYNNIELQVSSYEMLSLVYEKANDPAKALFFYKKYTYLNDSLFDQRNVSEAAGLANEFALTENRKKVDELLFDQKMKDWQIEKEKNYRWFLFITIAILIISISFILVAFRGRKKMNEQLALKNKELLLRKQITPHFLFNTFNNLYVTTLKSPKLAADMVLGLADVMRYQLRELNNPKAELINEMDYVKNLLLLEKTLKPGLDISIDFNEDAAKDIYVEPLIYTTLVENAIKHGAHNAGSGYVNVTVIIDGHSVCFNILNSTPCEKIDTLVSGTGLKNLKQRLELSYKGNYNLQVMHHQNEYSVKLNLNIK